MYTASAAYDLISESVERSEVAHICFSEILHGVKYAKYLHIQFKVKVHEDCAALRERWLGFLKVFGGIEGVEYSYDLDKDVFDLKTRDTPNLVSLWFLTFVRYLQEFPEIVVDFCNKNLDISSGFSEFFESHKRTCVFYNNLAGHGLAFFVYDDRTPSFEKYKAILQAKNLSSIQALYNESCR